MQQFVLMMTAIVGNMAVKDIREDQGRRPIPYNVDCLLATSQSRYREFPIDDCQDVRDLDVPMIQVSTDSGNGCAIAGGRQIQDSWMP